MTTINEYYGLNQKEQDDIALFILMLVNTYENDGLRPIEFADMYFGFVQKHKLHVNKACLAKVSTLISHYAKITEDE